MPFRGGSFAAAARRLGFPANTISRRLQEFERRVGQRLLQRSTRRMARSGPDDRMIWRLDGPGGESEAFVTGRFLANSAQVQLNAALAGFGIAFLPTLMTKPHLEARRLVQVLPQHGLNGVGVYFVYLSRRELPRAVKAFMDFTVAQMRDGGLSPPRPPIESERASDGKARGAVAS